MTESINNIYNKILFHVKCITFYEKKIDEKIDKLLSLGQKMHSNRKLIKLCMKKNNFIKSFKMLLKNECVIDEINKFSYISELCTDYLKLSDEYFQERNNKNLFNDQRINMLYYYINNILIPEL